jgi:hypothetical protein
VDAPLGQIIDFNALGSVVVASLVAGVGLSAVFSLVVASATRAADLRRAGNLLGSTVLGLVAAIGVVGCLALVAFGIHLMASK